MNGQPTEFAANRASLEAALSDPALRNPARYLLWEVCQACGDRASGLEHLRAAIREDPLQMRIATRPERVRRTVIALAAAGDLQANLPLSMLFDETTLLHSLWIDRPGMPIPLLPQADCIFVSIAEASRHRDLLEEADRIAAATGLPIINDGARIATLTRDGACALLEPVPGLVTPRHRRMDASHLRAAPPPMPFIVRPVQSHAGAGLALIADAPVLGAYLDGHEPTTAFFVAPFMDYRGADGLFRKARIAFVDRRPFPVHLAIHEDWAVWYYNAGMERSPSKRAEEGAFLRDMPAVLGARAMDVLAALGRAIDLDYVGLDCGLLADGRLVAFEVETGMVVHDRDPAALYPEKGPAIQRIRTALHALIDARRQSPTQRG